uniref:Uncharacterized protein n=1 Tax=Anguilla anguilla TaxID=7936 RepID=A0A0E9XKB2_ANGAN
MMKMTTKRKMTMTILKMSQTMTINPKRVFEPNRQMYFEAICILFCA